MKQRFRQTLNESNLVSSLIFVFCLFCSWTINAQISKSYEKEISVSPDVKIETNVPTDFWLEMSGDIVTDNTYDRYIISGKNGDQRLNINKEYNIHTWDKNTVKQVVTIKGSSQSYAEENELTEALYIDFTSNADGTLLIDANLNIEKFTLKNGFFKSDESTIILENGSQHKIDKLTIESTLYIPKTANLTVVGTRNVTLRLDDMEGHLELVLSYAEVYGKSLNSLNASFNYCYGAYFDKVENAEVNAINSHIAIDEVNVLEVGKEKISNRCLAPSLHEIKKYNSFQNSFEINEVKDMKVYESANDVFKIETVRNVNVIKSAFCQFNINLLNNSFDLIAKNSEVKLYRVNKDFKMISMVNTIGEIFMGFEDDSNYKLRLLSDNYVESNLGYNIKEIESSNETEKFYKAGAGNAGEVYLDCDRCKLTIK